jgi:phosphoglycolate phosphatase-like HAD superfamily hydrolase
MTILVTKYKSVCFAFDGTLIDSCRAKAEIFRKFASEYGSLRTLELIEDDYSDRFDLMKAFFEAENLAPPSIQLLASWSGKIDERVLDCPLIEGAECLLESLLTSGVHLTLASLTPDASLTRIIATIEIDRYFHDVYGSSACKTQVLMGLKRKFRGGVAMVGDGLGDKNAAMAAGVDFFGVGECSQMGQAFPIHKLKNLKAKLI